MFTMVSDLGKLKRKVDLLGSPKDTLSHRYCSMHTRCDQQGCVGAPASCAVLAWISRARPPTPPLSLHHWPTAPILLCCCCCCPAVPDMLCLQGGAGHAQPQHTVDGKGHQGAAGGAQQGEGSAAGAAAGQAAETDAGLCSGTAGGRLGLPGGRMSAAQAGWTWGTGCSHDSPNAQTLL